VVLVVDEYHLDIRADGDLIGRYYLAEVEVARDIAERFILFLGDDEMEFLAEDALQFAYDGVAAMQEAWLAAQKKRRRHRRAAAESARRKDEEQLMPPPPPAPVREPAETRPTRTRPAAARSSQPAPQSELAKRIAAASRLEEATRQQSRPPSTDEELIELLPVEPPAPEEALAADVNGRRSTPPLFDEEVVPPKPRRAPRRKVEEEPVVEEERVVEEEKVQAPPKVKKPAPPDRPVKTPKRAARTVDVEPEPAPPSPPPPPAAPPEPREEETVTSGERFAQSGHHPAETSVGLLSRLRRQPKVPTNHVHRFQESRSAVGLVRRVCVECSYVSIGSDD
jgi:hypothetical protein